MTTDTVNPQTLSDQVTTALNALAKLNDGARGDVVDNLLGPVAWPCLCGLWALRCSLPPSTIPTSDDVRMVEEVYCEHPKRRPEHLRNWSTSPF